MERGVLCTRHPWCVCLHGHDGDCARTVGSEEIICAIADRVLAEAPQLLPAWDARTPDPRGWRDARRYR